MTERRRSVMGIVFLTVFLDMVGFSIIFPLFPDMLSHYVEVEGEGSLVGRLATWLAEFARDDFAVIALFGGILGSLYSALQFVFAPVWGVLSDRIGRRPTLLVTLAGTAFSYILWACAGTFALLIVARLVGGVMAGNISTASAAIADTHEGKDRAKGMGIMGAGIGLGFVLGPAIGGMTWHLTRDVDWSGGASFGFNPFTGCALVALVLAILNVAWAWRRFPETNPQEKRGAAARDHSFNPFGVLKSIDRPGVAATALAHFVFFVAFGAMEFTLTFLAKERLDFTPKDNAWMFVFVGLLIALVQGGFVRRVAPRYGERKVATMGILITLPGFLVLGYAHGVGQLYLGLGLLSVGSAFVMPCTSALVSRYSPADRQGAALGVFRSLGSLARAIGPIMGGVLYWKIGSSGPYVTGCVLTLIPLFIVLRLPPVPEGDV